MNPFLGRQQAWLEAQLRLAQEDLAAGKTLSEWNGPDSGASKMVQMTPLQRIEFLLQALSVVNPADYPPSQASRASRTRVKAFQRYGGGA